MKFLAAAFALAAFTQTGTALAAEPTATLTVRFEQIEAPTGQVMFSLYDSEAAHDAGGKPVRGAMAKVEGNTAVAVIEGLPPGRYAIKAFHDIDGDGQMKSNPFGAPLEPFAFSNNAKAEGGPAKWTAASFDVVAGAAETRIAIK